MAGSPYSRYKEHDMILRDHLAADRTIMSNERTFLSYIRTALSLFVVGATFIKFFENFYIAIIGWIFMPLAGLALIYGFVRYRNMKEDISSVK